MKESYDQFIIAQNQYKSDKENTLDSHSEFLNRLFENEVTNKDALNNLERNFNEKIVEFNAHFEQIANLLSKEMVRKSLAHEVMSNISRLIGEKIYTLEVELSSSIAKVKDECVSKIETEKPKSSSSPNVDLIFEKMRVILIYFKMM